MCKIVCVKPSWDLYAATQLSYFRRKEPRGWQWKQSYPALSKHFLQWQAMLKSREILEITSLSLVKRNWLRRKEKIFFCVQLRGTREAHKKPRSEIAVITVVFFTGTDSVFIISYTKREWKWLRIICWESVLIIMVDANW